MSGAQPEVRNKFVKAARKALLKLTLRSDLKGMSGEDQFYQAFQQAMTANNFAADNLLFWSEPKPNSDDLGSRRAAESMARNNGMVTLAMLYPTRDEVINALHDGKSDDEAALLVNEHWKRASRAFARCAEGTVRVILSGSPRDGTNWPNESDFFVKYEWPILIGEDTKRSNGGVKEIYRFEKVMDTSTEGAKGFFGKYALIWSAAKGVIPQNKIKLLDTKSSQHEEE